MQQSVCPEAGNSSLAVKSVSFAPSLTLLSSDPAQADRTVILNDTYFSQTLLTLTTGVFLSGFAMSLGAPNVVIGLLVAIPQLAQLLQLPGIYLIEKFQSRRAITVWGTLASRALLLPLILVAFLPTHQAAITGLTLIYLLSASLGAIATCAWNSWLRDVLPVSELGRFFSRKLSLASLINSGLTLMGGYFLDAWGDTHAPSDLTGYSLLFFFAVLVGLWGVLPLKKMSEVPPALAVQPKPSLRENFGEPFKNRNYRHLITFLFVWNFSVNLALPFFTIYMLGKLGASLSTVTWLAIVAQMSNFVFMKTWGNLIDRFSNKSVLRLCVPLVLVCILGWAMISISGKSAALWPGIVALQLLLGFSTAGTTLATNNIALKLAPESKATACLATNAMTSSLASGLAPLLAGLLIDVLKTWNGVFHWPVFNQTPVVFNVWAVLFLTALGLGLTSLFLLASIDETGTVKKRIVVKALFGKLEEIA